MVLIHSSVPTRATHEQMGWPDAYDTASSVARKFHRHVLDHWQYLVSVKESMSR